MSDVVYVVTEQSAVGETVLGVFATIEAARSVVPSGNGVRLEDYRIQGHVLGDAPDARTAWTVVLTREGSVESAEACVT
jgi:hypothetical protein